jgi:hypothetical protein
MTEGGLQAHDFSGPNEQSLFAHQDVRKKTCERASPGLLDAGTHLRTWGTPKELQQPLRQLPFIDSLTCRNKSLARDDKFVATLL